TLSSLKSSDMYKIIVEGKAKFEYFDYGYDLLSQIPSFTRDQVMYYAGKNDLIPEGLRPTLLELAKQKFLDSYQEKNNYYRMLNGLPDLNVEGIYLDTDDVAKLNNEFFDSSKMIHEM